MIRKFTSVILVILSLLLNTFPVTIITAESSNNLLMQNDTNLSNIHNWIQVEAGGCFTLALESNGDLWAWGFNNDGRLGDGTEISTSEPIKIMNDVKYISAGSTHSLAIKKDNSLWSWGNNSCGQLGDGTNTNRSRPIKIMDNVKSISAGSDRSLAIKEDGNLWAWGLLEYSEIVANNISSNQPIKIMDNVKKASASFSFCSVLKEDGSLWTWGNNDFGQLGDGTNTSNEKTPIKIMNDIKDISCGMANGLALKNNNSLWSWGQTLKSDSSVSCVLVPENIMNNVLYLTSIKNINRLVIKEDKSLWSWGSKGECIGDGSKESKSSPVKIMENVKYASLGDDHGAAIKEDGSLWTWGENGFGQLGDGTQKSSAIPIKIMDGARPQISAGSCFSFLLKNDGSLWLWGMSYLNRDKNGYPIKESLPKKVMDGVQNIALNSGNSTCYYVIKKDGSLWQLYDKNSDIINLSLYPMKIMDNVNAVSTSNGTTYVIKKDNTLWAWGTNSGRLGDGTNVDRDKPVKIMENVQEVAAGGGHTLAIMKDGSLWTWGKNYWGELGDGTNSDSYSPIKIMEGVKAISAGIGTSLAIKDDGSLWEWGAIWKVDDGNYNVSDYKIATQYNRPVKILENVSSISCSAYFKLAIDNDGFLHKLGETPTKYLDRVWVASSGYNHSLIIKQDGTLWAWGNNDYGQIGDGTLESSIMPVKIMEGLITDLSSSTESETPTKFATATPINTSIAAVTPTSTSALSPTVTATPRPVSTPTAVSTPKTTINLNVSPSPYSSGNLVPNTNTVQLITTTSPTSSQPSVTPSPTTFKPDINVTVTPTASKVITLEPEPTQNPGYIVTYQDIKGHWAEKDITTLIAKELIKGYEDNSIKPDNFITRNEALLIIAKLAKIEPDSNQDIYFKDIDSIPKWVSPYLSIIIKYGIVEGYDDNTFKGNNKLTRAQAATILAKILYQMKQITLPDSSKDFVPRSKVIAFKDFNKSHWANTYLDIAFVNGIMGGYNDGTIRADKNITRAEFFTMCTKLLNLLK